MRFYSLQNTCDHRNSEPWGWAEYNEYEHWFCRTCYARTRITRRSWDERMILGEGDIQPDIPTTGLCEHRGDKKPLAQHTTNQAGPRALCMDCGCAVEHPEGPGSWEEVVFNGLLIEEEDEPELRRTRGGALPGS